MPASERPQTHSLDRAATGIGNLITIFIEILGPCFKLRVISVLILGVVDHRMARKTFGAKRETVIGECRRLHNEELRNLYST
jgi:hypothetical protein